MTAMKPFLVRIPVSMNKEIDAICDSQYCTKSAFIRQSIRRNIEITLHVETPLLQNHHREAIAKQLKVLTSISNDGKESQ